MKKFIVAILAILYISTSTGATLHLHYCMGKLVEWGFLHNKEEKCSKCGMKKSGKSDKGCCRDEHKQIKLEKDQKTPESAFQMIQGAPVTVPASFIEMPSPYFPLLTAVNPISHSPPRSCGIAVYIRNCVFLI